MTSEPREPSEPVLRLEAFRVRMYRSIRDSGDVPVFRLTALVGRHRAGKTSLLRALRGLAPGSPEPYSLEDDWPRGQRHTRGLVHVVCAARFRLGAEARAELVARGALDAEACGLRVEATYGGGRRASPWTEGQDRPLARDPAPSSAELEAFVDARLPSLLYADDETLLPAAIDLDASSARRSADDETGVAALAELLAEARAEGTPAEALEALRDPRRAREAGERLRERLARGGWHAPVSLDAAGDRLELHVESGGVRTPLDAAPRELRFRLTLEVRLAAARRDERGAVLLLDGPGRAFRRARRGRMRALFQRWVEAGAGVVYTARLPFEIELQHPEQVLVLEQAPHGALVARRASEERERLALRAALGMTGRSSFRIGDRNLVVEGPSDARILRALDTLLRRSGEDGLPPDLELTSAQGAHEVAAVARFLGRQGLGVVALLDSDSAGATAARELFEASRDEPSLRRIETLRVATAAGLRGAEAAIEDLFPPALYLDVVRRVCGREAAPLVAEAFPDERTARELGNPGARLAQTFEAHGRRFPKGAVTDALEARLEATASLDELPDEMARAVRRLAGTVRAAAARLRGAEPAGAAER